MRYVLNNFYDGAKQDALDLVTGTYVVSKGARSETLPSKSAPARC